MGIKIHNMKLNKTATDEEQTRQSQMQPKHSKLQNLREYNEAKQTKCRRRRRRKVKILHFATSTIDSIAIYILNTISIRLHFIRISFHP